MDRELPHLLPGRPARAAGVTDRGFRDDDCARRSSAGVGPGRGAAFAALLAAGLAIAALPPAAPAKAPALSAPAAEARSYAERRLGEVSFAVRSGPARGGHGEGTRFETRSVVKVMLMAAYLRSREVRERKLRSGEKVLLRRMIRFSNNAAASELTTRIEARELYRLARAAKMRDFRYELPYWGNSTTTAADQIGFMHRFKRLLPRRHSGYAHQLLRTITKRQRWGVADAKPDGWRLYFKSGWGSGTGEQEHQVALLKRAGCRVSLAIFTRDNPSARYGRSTQRGVARRLLEGLSPRSC